MPFPRTPSALLETKGAYIKEPSRKLERANEPTTDRPIGDPPEYLTKAERKVWRELVKQSCPGVLKEPDRLMFAMLVGLATKFQNREKMVIAETNQMITLSSKFALNPADRSRVQVAAAPKSNLQSFLGNRPTPISKPKLVVNS
jgi:phage terminase small subunit